MKHLRSILFLTLLLACSSNLLAQTVVTTHTDAGCVAFVKQDRSQLWLKRPDTAAYVILKADANQSSHTSFTKIQNLAILDQSLDGTIDLLGGTFTFWNPWSNSAFVTWTGVISIRADSLMDLAHQLSHVHFLKTASYGTAKFRPVGMIAPGRKWYAAMVTEYTGIQPGVTFYHGSLDSSFNIGGATADPGLVIDSAIPKARSGSPNDWHMSNISLSPDGRDMAAIVFEQLQNPASFAIWAYHWQFTDFGNTLYEPMITNYTNLVPHGATTADTLWGASVRVLTNTNGNSQAEIGLVNASGPALNLYTYNYSNYATMTQTDVVPLPTNSAEYYFAGMNQNGGYQEDNVDAAVHAMGGDVYFSKTGDSVVYITHAAADEDNIPLRDSLSEIYVGTLNGGVQSVYNDKTGEELQPVFVQALSYDLWHPGLTALSSTLTFTSLDTGKTSSAQTITITDSSTHAPATADSVVVHGSSDFVITGLPISPTAISSGSPLTLSVAFKPSAPAGVKYDTVIVYSSGSVTPKVMVTMSGTATIAPPPPPKGVREEDPAVFQMTVSPNPFGSSAEVSLVAPEVNSVAIVVHDALGRQVYASEVRKAAAGQNETFSFDAGSLGLPAGAYYVTAIIGDRSATRQVVFAK